MKSRVGIWILSVRGADGSPTAGTVMLAVIPFMLGIQMLLVALQLDIQESPKLPTLPPLRPHATPDPQLPAAGGGAQDLGTRGAVTRGRGAATEPLTNEVEGA